MPIHLIIPTDPVERAMSAIYGHVAADRAAKVYLMPSRGRRRPGRPARYTIVGDDFPMFTAPAFSGHTDAEAAEKANRWLTEHGY